jgi:hypothetical protein
MNESPSDPPRRRCCPATMRKGYGLFDAIRHKCAFRDEPAVKPVSIKNNIRIIRKYQKDSATPKAARKAQGPIRAPLPEADFVCTANPLLLFRILDRQPPP